jgi:hypothetical protein
MPSANPQPEQTELDLLLSQYQQMAESMGMVDGLTGYRGENAHIRLIVETWTWMLIASFRPCRRSSERESERLKSPLRKCISVEQHPLRLWFELGASVKCDAAIHPVSLQHRLLCKHL